MSFKEFLSEVADVHVREYAEGFYAYKLTESGMRVHSIYVTPSERGKGTYTALFAAMEAEAKSLGVKRIYGELDLENNHIERALAAHLKQGARIIKAHGNVITVAKDL